MSGAAGEGREGHIHIFIYTETFIHHPQSHLPGLANALIRLVCGWLDQATQDKFLAFLKGEKDWTDWPKFLEDIMYKGKCQGLEKGGYICV